MQRLSWKTKAGYGIGDLGGNLFFTLGGFYFLFYLTNILGMPSELAGTALMLGKIWDAVTDPVVGFLSDRTRSRHGRRRPWLFVGSWIILGGMVMMFSPPAGAAFLWIVTANCILNTGYTFINIPYGALAPDLTEDFHERTELNGWRMSFAVVGTFVGAGVVIPLVNAFGGGTQGWTGMAVVVGSLIALTTLIVVISIREPALRVAPAKTGIIRSHIEVFRLKPFLLALIPWSLHITGVNVIQAALLFYFRFIYGDEAAFQIALPILLASAIICIPVWVRISKRVGKRTSYNAGMAIFAGSVLLFFAFGHLAGPAVAFVVMAVAGVGFATQYVMPYAMVPDIVEYDFAENGVRREGVLYGMWTFMSKIGQAVAVAINGWVLAAFGYREAVAGVEMEQSASALFGIRLLVGPVPALFFIVGIAVLHFYPITNAYYATIKEKAHARLAALGDGEA